MNDSLKYRKLIVEAKRAWDIDPRQRILNAKSAIGQTITERQKELAIFGGGVAILSKAEGKPILLYSPEVQKQFGIKMDADNYEYLHTPYDVVWKKNGFSAFIDLLFFISRDKQRPEYVGKISDLKAKDKFEYPFQRSLRNDFEILHCSAGEILCFTLLWRLLIELAIKNNSLDCNYSKTLFQSQSQTDNWFEVFQRPQNDVFEKLLIEKLVEEPSKSKNILSKNVWEAKKDFSVSVKCGKSVKYIFKDLGLFKSKALVELNRYIQFVFKDKSLQLNEYNADDFADKLILAFAKTAKVETNKMSLENLLNGLHFYARFPILPYYFLMVFDKEKKLKEHIVFPLWYTFSPDTKYPYEENKSESAVLHALYTVKPIWEIKQYGNPVWYTSDSKSSTSKHNVAFERYLNDLYLFFTSMSKPIIDKEYYATEAKKNIEGIKSQATKAAISQVMARNTSHNLGSHVLNKLTGDLSSINIGDYKNYKSYFINKVFTNVDKDRLVQISKFNNYIKCRMDYLSDITFGIPAMQISKGLNSEILSDMDDVRLLLENISGLSNFEYSIKIESKIENGSDPAIAMPNDILGSQAFYNIIENIIRNTAKHSDKKTLNSKKKTNPVIEFTILISEIMDKSLDEGNIFYQVDVYDNVVITKKKKFKNDRDAKDAYIKNLKFNTNEEKKEALKNLTNLEYLVYSQNNKLNDSILKDDNTLRSTSLGLIEMEASACYLRKMDISNLESDDYQIDYNSEIKNSKGNLNILKAVAIDNKHLGYRLFVLKPTEALLIGNYELPANLKNNGFLCLSFEAFQKEIEKGAVFNHQFLVYEDEKVFELINLLEEVKGLNNTIIEVAKYKALLPKRIMQLPKTEINFTENQPNEVLKLFWEKWARSEKFDRCIIDVAVPKEEDSDKYHLLSHGESELLGEELKKFHCWFKSDTNKSYIEALSKEGKSKLPDFGEHTKGCDPKESITKYYNVIKKSSILKYPIIESAKTKVIIIDERVQNAAYNQKYGSYHYCKYYQHSNIIVPNDNLDLGANDLSAIKNKIELFVSEHISKDSFLVMHYSILERFFNKSNNREQDVHQWLNEHSTKTNVIVTSGRGTLKNLPPAVQFVNLSPLLASVIDFRSKFYLHQIIMSARKPGKI